MSRKSIFLLLSLPILLLQACGEEKPKDGFSISATGVPFKFHQQVQGKPASRGEVVMCRRILTDKAGAVLEDSQPEVWGYPLDNNSPLAKKIDVILLNAHIGDSLTFSLPAKYFFDTRFMPKSEVNKTILCHLAVKDIISFTAYQTIESEKQAKADSMRSQTDEAKIKTYLNSKSITAQKLSSGIFCQVQSLGKGKKPQPEDLLQINYKVYRISDGGLVDDSQKRGKPFEFVVGRGMVIQGLDKSVQLFPRGTKAIFFIPSDLAYGAEAKGEQLPPHSNLRFEVELLEAE